MKKKEYIEEFGIIEEGNIVSKEELIMGDEDEKVEKL